MTIANRLTVVFVSKRNSFRSVLAQACLEHLSKDRFTTLSCGCPWRIPNAIHPAALGALARARMRRPDMIPTAWTELKWVDLAKASFIITLDAQIHRLEPPWLGLPDSALWDMPDIAAQDDPDALAYGAIQVLYALRRRVELFVNLPLTTGYRANDRHDVRDLAWMS